MTQEQRDAWCKALRSGEYRQGTGQLCGDHEYCCLGVLCDTIDPGSWKPGEGYNGKYMTWRNFFGNVPSGLLPINTQRDAINLNDSQGKSFTEIADWIEQNVEVMP